MKIKKGDTVIVISGKDRGKTGNVIRAFPKMGTIIVEGINMKKKHQRPTKKMQKGQILDIASPLDVSNVHVVDEKSGKGARVGYKMEGGKKRRFLKKSGAMLS